MCGIAGFLDPNQSSDPISSIQAMTDAVQYRGPDDSGYWLDLTVGLALGHRRLSILDVSPLGHQPMISPNGRYIAVFNGEVYNFKELQSDLVALGYSFRGGSDTEVILAAIQAWGVDTSVKRMAGMFAIALWDLPEKKLYLFRDRLGKKPLYYGWNNGVFVFGSEIKSLSAHPKFAPTIDRGSLRLHFKYGYIPAPWSVYKDIFKLAPGSTLCLGLEQLSAKPLCFSPFVDDLVASPSPCSYWSVQSASSLAIAKPFSGTESEAVDRLDSILGKAVAVRMVSDVPLGAFLSGGIDSSIIVALMQRQKSSPINTFSVGFDEDSHNEAPFARRIAKHLGTNHTELYVSPADALEVVPLLPSMFDEPFSDSSQIPTYLVSKLCSKHVTVSLSGDGGDELFGGYSRYSWARNVWSVYRWIPSRMRQSIANIINTQPQSRYDVVYNRFESLIPSRLKVKNFGQKVSTFSRSLQYANQFDLYRGIMSQWQDHERLVYDAEVRRDAFDDMPLQEHSKSFSEDMMHLDMVSYLPDDILVKVDRASMAASLEARAPFLDHSVVEFACSLPTSYKMKGKEQKKILKQLLSRYVPAKMTNRPKQGFAIPVASWLRKELKTWAQELLSADRLHAQGYLNPAPIQEKWQEHLAGSDRWEHQIWSVLMFQAWLQKNSIPQGVA